MEPCVSNNECASATCDSRTNSCDSSSPVPAGMPCDSRARQCDGNGRCVACVDDTPCRSLSAVCNKTTHMCERHCPNGKVDLALGEQCDPQASEWVNGGGACSATCRWTSAIYRTCDATLTPICWPGSQYICGPNGMCSRACAVDSDCKTDDQPYAQCISVAGGRFCGIPPGRCPSGTMPVAIGPKGSTTPQICGTWNWDPETGPYR